MDFEKKKVGKRKQRDDSLEREIKGLLKSSDGEAKNLRTEEKSRLRNMLETLMKDQNWVEASGVLSVYMIATMKEKDPLINRLKYSSLLELLNRAERGKSAINPTKIRNIYDLWSKKNGSMKGWPLESRYVVDLEYILFCLMKGNVEDAHLAARWLKQANEVRNDPVSNMFIGLTFYEFWYSRIPEEFKCRDIDEVENTHMLATRCSNLGLSQTVESDAGGTNYQCDSETSVMNYVDDDQKMEVDDHKLHQSIVPQGLYLDSDDECTGNGEPLSNSRVHTRHVSSLHDLEGLDSWLLPLHLPDKSMFEEFIDIHKQLLNDNYKNAVEHLQLALDLPHSTSAALLPLVQLLLIGGRVDEALSMVEKHCTNSASAFPKRLLAALLEHFGPRNSVVLSSCFEKILKEDPTCSDSIAKLIRMQQDGEYSVESLLEMIAIHLDGTYAEPTVWRDFSLCFLKMSQTDEDRMSSSSLNHDENGHTQRHSSFLSNVFAGNTWKLRCRWWLTRHFSTAKLLSDTQTGDLQLLTYKAACASHMYGHESSYVVKAYSHLEKQNERKLLSFLDLHRHTSIGAHQKIQQKTKK